jgi:hypothetical protein
VRQYLSVHVPVSTENILTELNIDEKSFKPPMAKMEFLRETEQCPLKA